MNDTVLLIALLRMVLSFSDSLRNTAQELGQDGDCDRVKEDRERDPQKLFYTANGVDKINLKLIII